MSIQLNAIPYCDPQSPLCVCVCVCVRARLKDGDYKKINTATHTPGMEGRLLSGGGSV